MNKKLYRSSRQSVIAGVCGGLAEYLNVDVTIIRLVWILSLFAGGAGLIVYILAAIIVPKDDRARGTVVIDENGNETFVPEEGSNTGNNSMLFIGAALIIIGGLILGDRIFPIREIMREVRRYFFPGVLILAGMSILVSSLRRKG